MAASAVLFPAITTGEEATKPSSQVALFGAVGRDHFGQTILDVTKQREAASLDATGETHTPFMPNRAERRQVVNNVLCLLVCSVGEEQGLLCWRACLQQRASVSVAERTGRL